MLDFRDPPSVVMPGRGLELAVPLRSDLWCLGNRIELQGHNKHRWPYVNAVSRVETQRERSERTHKSLARELPLDRSVSRCGVFRDVEYGKKGPKRTNSGSDHSCCGRDLQGGLKRFPCDAAKVKTFTSSVRPLIRKRSLRTARSDTFP